MKEHLSLSGVFCEVPVSANLLPTVLRRITRARRRAAGVRLAVLTALAASSGALLVPILQYVGEEFYESGFYDYASLLLSDRGFVLASWREVSYSLVESLPSLAVLLLGVCLGAFIWSTWRAVSNAKIAFFLHTPHLPTSAVKA